MNTMCWMPDADGCGKRCPSGHCCADAIERAPSSNAAVETAIAATRRIDETCMGCSFRRNRAVPEWSRLRGARMQIGIRALRETARRVWANIVRDVEMRSAIVGLARANDRGG